jgi:sterol desaturase/sphingolipid hydroxylase (fatty acid hydroxylase superfamily)
MEMSNRIEPVTDLSRYRRLLTKIAAHKSNYWAGFVTDPVTATFFLIWDAAVLRGSALFLFGSYFLGLLSWSLFEYLFHRWVYHKGVNLAHAGHRLHHESPQTLIGMPWFLTSGFWLVWYLIGYQLQATYALTFMAGLVTGFNLYGVVHHLHHHFNLKHTWYRKLRIHHKIHHQYPEVNFGVTIRFWDYIFGTIYLKDERKGKTSGKRGERSNARINPRRTRNILAEGIIHEESHSIEASS